MQNFKEKFKTEKGTTTDKPLQCDHPRGIAVSNNRIVISDQEEHSQHTKFLVRVFNRESPKQILFTIVGKFQTIRGVAMDKDECIYVADCGHNRIVKFSSKGEYLNLREAGDTFGDDSVRLNGPYGVHIKDELLYVCDSGNSWIQIFDLDLNLRYRLGGQHAKPRFLFNPVDIVYNPADKHFYVVDKVNNKITKICIDLHEKSCTVSTIPKLVKSGQQIEFHKLRGITVFKNYILVTQVNYNFVLCLTAEGEFIREYNVEYPTDIAVHGETLYVCSHRNDTIQCFTLDM